MTDLIPQVREFHEKFGHPIADEPTLPSPERLALRIKLLREELQELRDAYAAQDAVEIVDAFGDLLYLVQGTALEFGVGLADEGKEDIDFASVVSGVIDLLDDWPQDLRIIHKVLTAMAMLLMLRSAASSVPMKSILKEIHRANMSKLGADGKPIYREDGKILKGPNYSPPDIARVLRASGFKV